MLEFLKSQLSPPVFADQQKSHVAALLNPIQLVILAVHAVWLLVAAFRRDVLPPDFQLALFVMIGGILLSRALTRRGRLAGASWLMTGALMVLATYICSQYGAASVGTLVFCLATLMAALTVPSRWVFATGAVSFLILVLVGWLQLVGVITPRPTDFGPHVISFITTANVVMVLIGWSSALQNRTYSQLRVSRRRQARLVEDSPDGIMLLDADGVVLSVNESMSTMTGFAAAVLQGRSFEEAPFLDEATYRALRDKLEVVCRGEERPFFELELTHQEARRFPVEVKVRKLEKVSGEAARCMVNLRDISARKQLDGQLREAARVETVGRLAGGVAHDFNNLLQTILTCTELLNGAGLGPSEQEDVDAIRTAAQRGADVVNKLSAFGRRQALSPRRVDLNLLVVELQGPLGRMLGDDIQLMTLLDAEPMLIEADPAQLEQVMVNLALNAREAMPGGGRICFETGLTGVDESLIGGSGPAPGLYVALRVRDSGPGIPVEIRDKIFDPFFTTRRGGSGLGLSSAHGILAQSGGAIRVRDTEHGACVELLLPAASWHAVPTPSPIGLSDCEATILLVEDREDVRVATVQLLRKMGYTVLEASGPAEARLLWEDEGPVDCLLTDVVMPAENGVELASSMRAQGFEGAVVFMSGYADRSILDEAALSGAWFIAKPFSRDALLETLANALESLSPRAIG